jgi:hypothetical protein
MPELRWNKSISPRIERHSMRGLFTGGDHAKSAFQFDLRVVMPECIYRASIFDD